MGQGGDQTDYVRSPSPARDRQSQNNQPTCWTQRRTRRPCDKASQRRRSWTRRRVVNRSCEQGAGVLNAGQVRAETEPNCAVIDHQHSPKTTMARDNEKERLTGRGGTRRRLRQADHLETEGCANTHVLQPSHCGARSQPLAPTVRAHGL